MSRHAYGCRLDRSFGRRTWGEVVLDAAGEALERGKCYRITAEYERKVEVTVALACFCASHFDFISTLNTKSLVLQSELCSSAEHGHDLDSLT